MTKTALSILEEIKKTPIINSHSHHLPDELLKDVDLNFVLSNSYANWICPPPNENNLEEISEYINRYRANTYFRWIFQAIENIYGYEFIPENYAAINKAVKAAYKNKGFHLDVLKKQCRYERIINERQPNPGSNLNHPEIFSPSFRCDCYFSAYLKTKPDPNGFYAYDTFQKKEIDDIDEYMQQVILAIEKKKQEGCVALKVAMAYERPITFEKPNYEKARKALNNPNASQEDILAFGDIVMQTIAQASYKFDMPLQIHTGMGQLKDTRPIGLLNLIENNPHTKFLVLHGGFPWFSDTFSLLHNYKNVYSDICWIPYLSTSAAKDYIITALEVSDAQRLMWGCDTWMSEDAFGALLAMEHCLAKALGEMVEDGAFSIDYAKYLVQRIMYKNGKEIFLKG